MPARLKGSLAPRVTGLGLISALGAGKGPTLAALRRGSAPEPTLYEDPALEPHSLPAFPLYRPASSAVSSCLDQETSASCHDDPELCLALASARLAVADAGLCAEALEAAGLIVTWEAAGMDRLLRSFVREFVSGGSGAPVPPSAEGFRDFYQRHREATYWSHSFLHLHTLARELGIHGPTLFINNACASGLYALEAAASWIRESRTGCVLVVAAESPRFPTKQMWFEECALASPSGRIRPFDAHRDGLVLGEGAATVILESDPSRQVRGQRAYGEYLGGGFHQEGWKIVTPNFAEPYHERVVRQALEAGDVAASEIDIVCAHGAATGLSDSYEAKGLRSVFGSWPEQPRVVALKGYFGHTLGACSLLEFGSMVVAMDQAILPATAGFEDDDPKLEIRPTVHGEKHEAKTLLKVANGFAGFNAAVVYRRLFEESHE